ncbi:MAG: DNA polymerase/3'-5' exonuclease PolX [Desulfobacterales bacterium]|jgi:DNA polymerase (family 10)
MPIHNTDIVKNFNKVADLLEIKGANPFRIRAYRNAARTIGSLSKSVADLIAEDGPLTDFSGIGKDLAEKIEEIVKSGTLSQLKALEKDLSPGLHDLLQIPGLGPKKVKALYEELDIDDLSSLKKAAQNQKIRNLEGFGAKTEASILEEIERYSRGKSRTKWVIVEEIARSYVDYLKKDNSVKDITVAGSYRRGQETVGDLDILVTVKRRSDIMAHFIDYEDVDRIISQGKTRSSVVLRTGLQVDLRVVPQISYGAALHYFTGSKAHNIAVRKLGQKKSLKINEYGVFKNDERRAGKTEKDVFKQVDLPYIEPELREDRGEIQAAQKNRLPDLIELADIRGDLHVHTNETDGREILEDMVSAAQERGYTYLAISNHSQHVSVDKGLNRKRLARQIEKIDRLNSESGNFVILKAIEVDILKDGSLDLPDDILKELDVVIGAVHSDFKLSRQKQTERILRAMDNPSFNILAHPSGRLINARQAYEVDLEGLIKAAGERGCFMELNAHPDRLDLNDVFCKTAKDLGVKIAVSTDAHSVTSLDHMRLGIRQARRGWLAVDDVLNTRSWQELKKFLQRS